MPRYQPEKVLAALLSFEFLCVLLFALLGLNHDFFHLDRESNLPTWFSSLQLFFVSYLGLIVASEEALLTSEDFCLRQPFWYVLSLGFVFLSLDEFCQIHELIEKRGRTPVWALTNAPRRS